MSNKYELPLEDNNMLIPNQTWGIFLVSILGLFLELLFIRWMGTEIRIFAYLQNTILVACFLGLGLGMFTSTKRIELKQGLIPMVFLLALLALPITREALGAISEMLSVLGDLVIWFNLVANNTTSTILLFLLGLALTYFLLALIVDIFVPVGRILGRLMNANSNPIWAYSVNILGSLIGTWALVLLSSFYQPPVIWLVVAGILLATIISWMKSDRGINLFLVIVSIILAWFAGRVPGSMSVIWSPYQKLVVKESGIDDVGKYVITVNNVGYQAIIDLSKANVLGNPDQFSPELNGLSQYDIPTLLHPDPKAVLIVGAGTGNDVAGALRNHAEFVTAVEIDPAIIAIGRELHPELPYRAANVRVVNDDARSFFATTDEKYDVISFGLLDSHTTTAMTNARLDHYVYTVESLKQAKSILKNRGIMVLSFEAQKIFIADRIRLALIEVFHQEPLVFIIPHNAYGWGGVMFVTGDLDTVRQQLNANPALALRITELQAARPIKWNDNANLTTDDWPYIYLENPKIPTLYYMLFGLMVLIFMRSSRKWQATINLSLTNREFWHFFFLGSAFLLLEVQNISKASVVLGNTWQVNAVIISGILGMALIANWITYKFPKLPTSLIYSLLIITAIGLYFIDLARFGFLPYPTKAIIVGSLTSLPMLFSGIVFTRSFAAASEKSNALGANLIGALLGALLQSLTFVFGIKALLLIVAGFYVLSLLTLPASVSTSNNVT